MRNAPGRAVAAASVVTAAVVVAAALRSAPAVPPATRPAATAPAGMRLVPAGSFDMGGTDARARPDEKPVHRVALAAFWIDETDVTNAQFAAFVAATGYVTTAEKPPAAGVAPGAIVFHATTGPVPLADCSQWWAWTPAATWRHPTGPASDLTGKSDHPVVQVSWDDATAYAAWAGKRLPTEAQWEYAARGRLAAKEYAWGDGPDPSTTPGAHDANVWHGHFPDRQAGTGTTTPVRSFPPNGYGLYDMSGNVWQWCDDWYRPDAYATAAATDPAGPADSVDPDEPGLAKRVTRGGSFLCHASYCASYRVAARMKTTPDTSSDHIGFRCVKPAGP